MEKFRKNDMTTMSSCVNRLQEEGYSENFVAKEKGLEAPTSKKVYEPDEMKIVNFYRFEGESDPADNAIVYALEAEDGTRGLVVDQYGGPYANRKVSEFITSVQEINKKEHTVKDE
jgi:hypothetical protein